MLWFRIILMRIRTQAKIVIRIRAAKGKNIFSPSFLYLSDDSKKLLKKSLYPPDPGENRRIRIRNTFFSSLFFRYSFYQRQKKQKFVPTLFSSSSSRRSRAATSSSALDGCELSSFSAASTKKNIHPIIDICTVEHG